MWLNSTWINTGSSEAVSSALVWQSAPSLRIIEIPRPRRGIIIPPRDRVIRFSGDDMSNFVAERTKQPSEVVDYDLDLRDWFAGLGVDFVQEASLESISPSGELEGGSDTNPEIVLVGSPARIVKVWVSGGNDGGEYLVTVKVTTNAGRVEEIDLRVFVEEAQ